MTTKTLAFTLGLIAFASSIKADPIPYAGIGTANPNTYSFAATADGPITAYFVGQSAGYGSQIGLSINGAPPTTYGLQNHTPPPNPAYGTSFNMGSVLTGDILRFVLAVSTTNGAGPTDPVGGTGDLSHYLYSDESLNPGGDNHIYSSPYGGDATIPAGTYIGFEDIVPLNDPNNDRDYNDHQFVFTNVGVTQHGTPEGGMTFTLLAMALTGLGLLRWKLSGVRTAS